MTHTIYKNNQVNSKCSRSPYVSNRDGFYSVWNCVDMDFIYY